MALRAGQGFTAASRFLNFRRLGAAASAAALTGVLGAAVAGFLYSRAPLPVEVAPPGAVTYQFQTPTGCGRPACRLNLLWPEDVHVDTLPEHVVAAFVSAEDRYFWEHGGVDARALVRASIACLRFHCQGGSTIPMQVAKLRYSGRDSTDFFPGFFLKLHEIFIAQFQLRREFSREQLLGRYLASVHFGNGLTGLRAASRYYFNKRPDQLSIAEAAYLAGTLPAPAHRDIIDDRERGVAAAARVLERMEEDGRINAAQRQAAEDRPALYRPGRPIAQRRPYLIAYLQEEAERAGYPLGATPAVTVDFALQTAAEDAIARHSAEARRLGANCAAIVAIRPDGAVLALVGGFDYTANQQNCAQSERQPGSAFKFITVAAAVSAGVRGDDWVEDGELCIGKDDDAWCPQNFDDHYYGWIPVRDAIAYSANSGAVQIGYRAGLGRVISLARRAGLDGGYSADRPAFLLGAVEATPLDMALALARITGCGDADLHVFPTTTRTCEPLLDRRDLDEFNDIMTAPIIYGTGQGARFRDAYGCIGKTGTSNDQRDAWFVGRCGEIIAVVWMGRRNGTPIRMTGGHTPARTWRTFMQAAMRIEAEAS